MNKGNLIWRFLLLDWTIAVIMMVLACGVKGPPRPPERLIPEGIKDLSLRVMGRNVILEWSVPKRTTSGIPLKDLDGFTIMRGRPGKCPTCPVRFEAVAKIEYRYSDKSQTPAGKIVYSDTDLKPGVYVYSVRSYNKKGYESPDSNHASIELPISASAPRGLRAIPRDGEVELIWEPVTTFEDGNPITHLSGYNVYRGDEHLKYGRLPINEKPVVETSYLDLKVKNNRRYFYAVRAVRSVNGKIIEGILSNEVQAIPQDMTPPAPPQGLSCHSAEDGVLLVWMENREEDLKGYNVYRKTEGQTGFEKITPFPIKETKFLDRNVFPKGWYIYAVTAVDDSLRANESTYSMECQINYRK